MESLWLSSRASESRIRRSEVRFRMGTLFLCPTLATRLKPSSFLNRDQNLPSLLFLPNCLFMKLQLFVSAYMNALWIHSKNCCKYITHTYACIGSPERNKSTNICIYVIRPSGGPYWEKRCLLSWVLIRTDPRLVNNINESSYTLIK